MMMLSLTAFSQVGTVQAPTKCLPIPVFRMIVKDLLIGDEAKIQLKLTEKQLNLTEKKIVAKDSIIAIMEVKESHHKTIHEIQNQKYDVLENYTKKIEKDLKNEKVKGKFLNIVSGGIVVFLTALLIVR